MMSDRAMWVEPWGVRGSLASPGQRTHAVGGNTSVFVIETAERRVILDAGTGLHGLGATLDRQSLASTTLLFSHYHWDHIQGLPFFRPLYGPGPALDLRGPVLDGHGPRVALAQQMQTPMFPVPFAVLEQRLALRALPELAAGTFELDGDVRVRWARLNHPGGVVGYRIEHAGLAICYATDVEHEREDEPDPVLLALADGADLLVYDAMYTPEEYDGQVGSGRHGWGHSTYRAGALLARRAGVGRLWLHHHDPDRDDAAVEQLVERARELFPQTEAARERCRLALGSARRAA